MAPEILKGGNYEESADVYSYGMILWEILSLEIPYFGIDPRKLMNIVAEERKIVEVPKKGNAHIIQLTSKCLNYDPHKRPALKEIVDSLESVLNQNKFNSIFILIFRYLYGRNS
jgi:serine/threonine protein kinase